MLVVYLYPDGTAESARSTTAVSEAIGDVQKKNQAVVVLTVDEYSGEVKVIKDRYQDTPGAIKAPREGANLIAAIAEQTHEELERIKRETPGITEAEAKKLLKIQRRIANNRMDYSD